MKNYVTLIVVIAIGCNTMLIGQTVPTVVANHNHYFIYGTWKKAGTESNPTHQKTLDKKLTNTTSNEAETISNINTKIEDYNARFVALQNFKKEINVEINSFFGSDTITGLKSNQVSLGQRYTLTNNEIEFIKNNAYALREKAKTVKDNTQLLADALALEIQCVEKQIEAAEVSLRVFNEKYMFNKMTIYSLLYNDQQDQLTINTINNFLAEADKYLQTAKMLREEAYAQRNKSAKLGGLNNAEEKEILALNKQEKAIAILNENKTSSKGLAGKF